jgi:hypothetical protein
MSPRSSCACQQVRAVTHARIKTDKVDAKALAERLAAV